MSEINNLEKMIFLEMTNKAFSKLPDEEYYETYDKLSEAEKTRFFPLVNEIHEIWSHINMPADIKVFFERKANTILEYHNNVAPVDELILKISNDFNIDLKDVISPEFAEAIKRLLGITFYKKHFGSNP